MKHLLRGLFIAVLFICCNFQLVLAQPMQELPVDKNVRIGKLDNGLTYYIRHNALPEKRVEFYIAQKVGSIPVSYTHLDVYKRQVYGRLFAQYPRPILHGRWNESVQSERSGSHWKS